MQVGPVRALLELRERWAGPAASFTTNRFLYETVGQLHYIRWTPEDGHKVRLVSQCSATRAYACVRACLCVCMGALLQTRAREYPGRCLCGMCCERSRRRVGARGAWVGLEAAASVKPSEGRPSQVMTHSP